MADLELDEILNKSKEKELGKVPGYINIQAAQNGILARVYRAQEELMQIITLVGTIPSNELIMGAEHLHVSIENIEAHIRKMNGRHTSDE